MNDEESAPSCDEIESVTLDIQNHGDGNDFADLENKVVTDLSQMDLEARIAQVMGPLAMGYQNYCWRQAKDNSYLQYCQSCLTAWA